MLSEISRFVFGFSLWFFIIGVAIWRGGWPERVVGVTNIVGMVLTPIVQEKSFHNHFQLNLCLVDAAVMLAFLYVALRSDRWWPLFAAAAALMTVLTDLAYLLVHMPLRLALTGETVWSYMAIWSLAGGIFEIEWRRKRGRRRPSPSPASTPARPA